MSIRPPTSSGWSPRASTTSCRVLAAFGKSLFVDTLKEVFEGNEPLFQGLAIHDQWDWSVRHPVLRLDFSSGNFKDPSYLHENLMEQLTAIERRAGVIAESATAPLRSLAGDTTRRDRPAGSRTG